MNKNSTCAECGGLQVKGNEVLGWGGSYCYCPKKNTLEVVLPKTTTEFKPNFFDGDNYSVFSIKNIQGKILTLLEATITNDSQLKATKELVKSYFSELLNKPNITVTNGGAYASNGTNVLQFKKE